MILIDTVYQRVLALANKEQRGYITPQEFNLLANQAQIEIFEQYFYDENQADRNLKNSTQFSNVDEILDEKISVFKKQSPITISSSVGSLPADLYRLGSIIISATGAEVEQVTEEEIMYLLQSPLAKPTVDFPAFVRSKVDKVRLYPVTVGFPGIHCQYIKKPVDVNWGYLVINGKALYDNGASTVNFELHPSDETELVYKILALAGVTINKSGLAQIGEQQITTQKTQEKQ